jgi:uncharacterized protein (TIGR02145 family)
MSDALLPNQTTMKHLLTAFACFFAMSLSAQTWPWNPDIDSDGIIGTEDLLALLSVFDLEFQAQLLVTDSSSAMISVGEMDFWDCAGTCSSLEGNWKVMDDKLVGNYKDDLMGWSESGNVWLDPRVFPPGVVFENGAFSVQNVINLSTWNLGHSNSGEIQSCVCQTRVVQPINIPSAQCEYVDICGVCEGPGPIYSCGCEEMPEWACDCDGNQLDVLDVCGGGCLGDYDGDGVCDEYGPGACGGLSTWDHEGFTYDLVEIAGRCWFKQDLRTEKYANGDSIPHGISTQDWVDLGAEHVGGWSVYEGYEYNGNVYNWYAVNDERGLCPSGWKVPSRDDYMNLCDTALSANPNGNIPGWGAAQALKGADLWNGLDLLGYTASQTTTRAWNNATWLTGNSHAAWSRTFYSITTSRDFYLPGSTPSSNTTYNLTILYNGTEPKGTGLSVRCIKDQ